jgi:hypothetical protein
VALGLKREQWAKREPRLSADEGLALDVWQFCEGWRPEALPTAAAYFGVADVAGLLDHMLVLRDVIAERRRAEESVGGR